VFKYDRRRGDSGDAAEDAVEREVRAVSVVSCRAAERLVDVVPLAG
jgi:hypothetical protein